MIPSSLKMKRSDFTLSKECRKRRIRGRYLLFTLFQCNSNEGGEIQKFSVSISKKRVKTSVKRNRIKRQVYSLVRKYIPLFTQHPHFSLISISLLVSNESISFSDLERDFLIFKEELERR